ncbi:TPA: glutamyl aminopeptidase [Streptococcus pyogenes]
MTDLFSKIKEVTELDGIAGYEHSVRDYLRTKITPLVDRVETDGLGGIFGIRDSKAEKAPRILVAAHMDEVGFMVSDIKVDGTLRVVGIGGWNPLVVSSQRFTLYTRTGQVIPLISGSVPPHFLRGANGSASLPHIEDIVFDGGFTDKAEAERFGITPGDIIIPQSETILTAKFDPELFFAVDCSPAGDIYGNPGTIGDGTLLRFYDPGHVMLKDMRDFLLTTAEEAGVNFQYYCGKGGTDAGAAHLQNGGVPSTTIGVCARYIHSHQTLYAMDDFVEAQAFLQAIIKKLDRSTVDLIKCY